MDDWLIFQYHLIRAHPESEVLREPFGATDQLGIREAKGGRRRVGRPTRWLSWGKRVGGLPGKSGRHIPRDVMPSRSRRSD
jgi:hypothetical protein